MQTASGCTAQRARSKTICARGKQPLRRTRCGTDGAHQTRLFFESAAVTTTELRPRPRQKVVSNAPRGASCSSRPRSQAPLFRVGRGHNARAAPGPTPEGGFQRTAGRLFFESAAVTTHELRPRPRQKAVANAPRGAFFFESAAVTTPELRPRPRQKVVSNALRGASFSSRPRSQRTSCARAHASRRLPTHRGAPSFSSRPRSQRPSCARAHARRRLPTHRGAPSFSSRPRSQRPGAQI